MNKKIIRCTLVFFVSFLFSVANSFAQLSEEKEEKTLEYRRPLIKPADYKLSLRAAVFTGYDSNVYLSPIRKGDIFQEARVFLNYSKPLVDDLKFSFDYSLDALSYNEATDLSSIFNSVKLGIHQRIADFKIGTGYNLISSYYPRNEDGDFLFHKTFAYVGHTINKRLYHSLEFEYGIKGYIHKKALLNSLTTYKDNDRRDERYSVEYSLSFTPLRNLVTGLRSKFLINDSNDRYLDFYDYKSFQETWDIAYEVFTNMYLLSNFLYIRKNYDERTITLGTSKQKDDLYAGTLGLAYKLDAHNVVSLYYTYRDNSSNDDLAEFSENVISCGWQYRF